jgi:hypothetical protein
MVLLLFNAALISMAIAARDPLDVKGETEYGLVMVRIGI